MRNISVVLACIAPKILPIWSSATPRRNAMAWSAPIVSEICVGMEVTSYESAEIDIFN
jgi:coenzyme PQQ precursor peptide PqqA